MSVPAPIKTEEVILENAEYNSTEELEEELQFQLEDSGGEGSSYQYTSDIIDNIERKRLVPQRQRIQQDSNMHSSGPLSLNATTLTGTNPKNASTIGEGIGSNKNILESEKRMRREIANSNERRRMQSINAGFQALRSLLPRHEGDKLSKAAILQQTSQYICDLENQKTQLLAQNSQLKRQLGQHESGNGNNNTCDTTVNSNEAAVNANGVTIKKRKLTAENVINIQTISDSSDEGLGSMSPEPMTLLNNGTNNGATKTSTIIAHTAAKELLELKKQLDKERCVRNLLENDLQKIRQQLFSVATAPPTSSAVVGSTYIPHEVIEHTDNLIRDSLDELPAGAVSYVEIDEMTGQQQVVVCSSIEELDNEAAAAAEEFITEDNVHEEVILSTTSSTESETEVNVQAIAKVYAEGNSPSDAVLQPILQAAIKATPKVEVERINEAIIKVKTEKIEQPSGLTRSRQNLETIVEAIRHLEGDHLFADGVDQQKQLHHHKSSQDTPLALTTTTKPQHVQSVHAQRTSTLAELRPFLQLKTNKQVTIVGGGGTALTVTQLAAAKKAASSHHILGETNSSVTPTTIFKVQTTNASTSAVTSDRGGTQQVTITSTALKQCRPGVIVAKQLS